MLFSPDFLDFVNTHQQEDVSRLLLSRGKYPSIDVNLAAECIISRKKLRAKCPSWAGSDMLCPLALSAEQCSSERTAAYKASVVSSGPDSRIADLTGGLGVDSAAFARTSAMVLYNEMRPELCQAAEHNFTALGLKEKILISNTEVSAGNIASLLESFRPDAVFMDPARRSSTGSKVFRLADCTPNVLELYPAILQSGARLVLKLSPMADITQLCRELPAVSTVHVIEWEGECKELLLELDPAYAAEQHPVRVKVVNLEEEGGAFSFLMQDTCTVPFASDLPAEGDVVFEPGKALMKSGAWNIFAGAYGMQSFGRDAHVFMLSPEKRSEVEATHLGRCYRVLECAEFGKAGISRFAQKYPGADVIAHALPLSSEELGKKLGSAKHGSAKPVRICGVGTANLGRLLLALEKN